MIEATYKNDFAEYKKFTFYTVFVLNNKKSLFITFEILGILALILSVCFLNALWFVIGLIFAAVGGLYYLLNRFVVNRKTKTAVNLSKDFYKISNEYIFYDDKMDVITSTGKKKNQSVLKYKDMFKVVEVKDFFYFYANSTIGLIIKKSGIKDGKIDELREIFKNAFDKKHCKCKK